MTWQKQSTGKPTPWVVIKNSPGPDCTFLCEHCGHTLTVKVPVQVEEFTAACDGFISKHENCKPKEPAGA